MMVVYEMRSLHCTWSQSGQVRGKPGSWIFSISMKRAACQVAIAVAPRSAAKSWRGTFVCWSCVFVCVCFLINLVTLPMPYIVCELFLQCLFVSFLFFLCVCLFVALVCFPTCIPTCIAAVRMSLCFCVCLYLCFCMFCVCLSPVWQQ